MNILMKDHLKIFTFYKHLLKLNCFNAFSLQCKPPPPPTPGTPAPGSRRQRLACLLVSQLPHPSLIKTFLLLAANFSRARMMLVELPRHTVREETKTTGQRGVFLRLGKFSQFFLCFIVSTAKMAWWDRSWRVLQSCKLWLYQPDSNKGWTLPRQQT